ncbi:hypothetical protein HYQ46_001516 [Verticillium longisporum]|nr:hypothetical protein HYQ46_001516 [Verticillium longisporum]
MSKKTLTVIGADITHGAVIDIGGSAMGAAILTRLRAALYDTLEGSPIVLPDELLNLSWSIWVLATFAKLASSWPSLSNASPRRPTSL